MAKKYDPDGIRTVGVLTKPDRIPTGEEHNWISILHNIKEPLENGWYCVKQPSSAEISAGTTWEQARKSEDEFFASTAVWSDLDELCKKYLCTRNLVERLSALLSDLISKRLPEIQDEIDKSIIDTRAALHKLPKAPSSDPRNEIANLLHVFVQDLARQVEGVPEAGLLQTVRPAHDKFRRVIRMTAPDFQPFKRSHARKKQKIDQAEFLLSEEGHEDLSIVNETIASESEESDEELRPPRTKKARSHSSRCDDVPTTNVIYIDEVMKKANEARTRELPGTYPFVVQGTFISAVIKKWHVPAQALCREVYCILGDHVRNLIHLHLGTFGQGQLAQRVKVILQDHLNKCMQNAEERIDWLMKIEQRPFSLNTHYFTDYKEKFLTHYRTAREKGRNSKLTSSIEQYKQVPGPSPQHHKNSYLEPPSGVSKALASLVEIGITGVKPEALAKLMESDGMDPALNIMADVRAYFQVAYKRFADNVPLAIDHELVWGIERNALEKLNIGLGINAKDGDQICRDLAQESIGIALRREELTKKLERMNLAMQQLLQIRY
ncbi:hypothetical protein C0992_000935 [Termitomyces sp. T32_za158]|nr:hypothetical protein C0992_000935 [Termitomyces sp. T32_za158]